jgi:predicted nucleotide-binding protein
MNSSIQDEGRRQVFLVHGRDQSAREALIALLTAFDLEIIDWHDAAARTGRGAPYTGEIVKAGMDLARAVVVLLTPDDIGYVHPDFREETDEQHERQPTGQARLNVVFEAGMAMERARERVVLVEVGQVRKMSDIDGVNIIHMDDSIERRLDLAGRLEATGLSVDTHSSNEWKTAGTFIRQTKRAVDLTTTSGRLTSPQDHSAVGNKQDVTGVITCLQAHVRALILVQSPRDRAYWPQAEVWPGPEGGGFESNATFGRSETLDIGKIYILMLVAATRAASDSFHASMGKRMSSLPPGIEILDEVTVTRR